MAEALRASHEQRDQVAGACPGHRGREHLEALAVRDRTSNAVHEIPARMLLVQIGAMPHTNWLEGVVQRDPNGFIRTGHDVDLANWQLDRRPLTFETSVPGVFAAGDVRLGSIKRVALAVGKGAGAVQNTHRYLEEAAAAGTPEGMAVRRQRQKA